MTRSNTWVRLSEGEKAQTLNAKSVADSGMPLSTREKELVDQFNLGDESQVVKRQDLAEARRAGFFEKFGSFEKTQMQGSLSRADELARIQREGESIGDNLSVKDREAKPRALNKAQEGIGLQQQFAGQQRPSGQSVGEGRFDSQAQQVRVEVQGRREFNVTITDDSEKTVAAVRVVLDSMLNKRDANMLMSFEAMVLKQKKDAMDFAKAAAMERRANK